MEATPWWAREHDHPAALPAPTGLPARDRRAAGRLVHHGVRRVRAAARADGADTSGLAALLALHALHSAGDALVMVSLAGTLFFDTSSLGQARGRVALYLLLTLLPFALLVPVAGPLLDRFRHGRRNVLALTCGFRGLVAWALAGLTASLSLYPLALSILVLSRAYGVARSAALPRVRPPAVSLVAANARVNIAAVAAATVAGALGAGISAVAGPGWTLRLAGVVLLLAGAAAVRLPDQVDEERSFEVAAPPYPLRAAPAVVRRPLLEAVALRALGGMLTLFLAFLLRADRAAPVTIAAVLGGAVVGQVLGTLLASRLGERAVRTLTLCALGAPAVVCGWAALHPGAALAALAAALTGLGGALSKFRLDAVLQLEVPGRQLSGAFARTETGLQLAWAVGGAVALAVPTRAGVGFAVAALFPVLGLVLGLRTRRP